eukprot:scaffold45739_cov52-Attheya_sp.AAC.1
MPTESQATLIANRQCDIFTTYSSTLYVQKVLVECLRSRRRQVVSIFELSIDPEALCIDFRFMNLYTCPQDDQELAFLLTGGNATIDYCNFLFTEPVTGGSVSKLGPDYDLDTCFTFCLEYTGQEALDDPAFYDDIFIGFNFNEGNCCSQSRTSATGPIPNSDYQ